MNDDLRCGRGAEESHAAPASGRPPAPAVRLTLLAAESVRQCLCRADIGLVVLLAPGAGRAQATDTGAPVLVLRADSETTRALIEARRNLSHGNGIIQPLTSDAFAASVRVAVRDAAAAEAGEERAGELCDGHRLIGKSKAMADIRADIARVSATDSNVLITGETGTGKELVAELVQKNSRRRHGRYVCFNCAAIPEGLLESELFGYERGAFTGAHTASPGKLESADGGTVFFDEIGEMSLQAQAKVLRLLESKEIQPLGAKRPRRIDFRVIAATNLDVDAPGSAAQFRRDLYFRLNVGRIHIPALRERRADIPLLLRYFFDHFNQQFGRGIEQIAEPAWKQLLAYDWPGNIRELKNVMEAMFVSLPRACGRTLEMPERMQRQMVRASASPCSEQEEMLRVLRLTDGNKSKAARELQWSRMTLYRKMAKYRIGASAAARS